MSGNKTGNAKSPISSVNSLCTGKSQVTFWGLTEVIISIIDVIVNTGTYFVERQAVGKIVLRFPGKDRSYCAWLEDPAKYRDTEGNYSTKHKQDT